MHYFSVTSESFVEGVSSVKTAQIASASYSSSNAISIPIIVGSAESTATSEVTGVSSVVEGSFSVVSDSAVVVVSSVAASVAESVSTGVAQASAVFFHQRDIDISSQAYSSAVSSVVEVGFSEASGSSASAVGAKYHSITFASSSLAYVSSVGAKIIHGSVSSIPSTHPFLASLATTRPSATNIELSFEFSQPYIPQEQPLVMMWEGAGLPRVVRTNAHTSSTSIVQLEGAGLGTEGFVAITGSADLSGVSGRIAAGQGASQSAASASASTELTWAVSASSDGTSLGEVQATSLAAFGAGQALGSASTDFLIGTLLGGQIESTGVSEAHSEGYEASAFGALQAVGESSTFGAGAEVLEGSVVIDNTSAVEAQSLALDTQGYGASEGLSSESFVGGTLVAGDFFGAGSAALSFNLGDLRNAAVESEGSSSSDVVGNGDVFGGSIEVVSFAETSFVGSVNSDRAISASGTSSTSFKLSYKRAMKASSSGVSIVSGASLSDAATVMSSVGSTSLAGAGAALHFTDMHAQCLSTATASLCLASDSAWAVESEAYLSAQSAVVKAALGRSLSRSTTLYRTQRLTPSFAVVGSSEVVAVSGATVGAACRTGASSIASGFGGSTRAASFAVTSASVALANTTRRVPCVGEVSSSSTVVCLSGGVVSGLASASGTSEAVFDLVGEGVSFTSSGKSEAVAVGVQARIVRTRMYCYTRSSRSVFRSARVRVSSVSSHSSSFVSGLS